MIARHALSFLVGISTLLYSQTISLRGRVLEKASLFPVPGATVKLAGTNHAALTDSNGRFTITETSTLNLKTGLSTPRHLLQLQCFKVPIYSLPPMEKIKR